MKNRTTLIAMALLLVVGVVFWRVRSPQVPAVGISDSYPVESPASTTGSGVQGLQGGGSLEPGLPPVTQPHQPEPAGTEIAQPPPFPSRDAIPGEFVLRFAGAYDQEQFLRTAKAAGVPILGQMAFGHAVRVKVKDRAALDELLRQSPTPADISNNYYIRTPTPKDRNPQAPEEGYIGFGSRSLDWLGVTDNDRWGFGVTVAVLDTGVQSHPALAESRISRIDLLPESKNAPNPHGTAVASLIAGTSDDLKGIAPQASILSIRVIDENGVGDTFTVAQGVVEAVDRGGGVITLCLGSYGDSPQLREAVNYAHDRGVVVVASTGNDAVEDVLFPAAYDNVVAVAGVDATKRHLYFSNRGKAVALSAPGIGIEAASADGGSLMFSGTSAAAPFVSGAVAALLSSNPGLRGEQAVEIMVSNADDVGPAGRDAEYGAGILNMQRVAQRNTRRIYDMTAADALLRTDAAGNLVATFTAQNRGTEDVYGVVMRITAPGTGQSVCFDCVRVGQTVSHDMILAPADVERSGQLRLTWTVELQNESDLHPQDNTRTLTLTAAGRK